MPEKLEESWRNAADQAHGKRKGATTRVVLKSSVCSKEAKYWEKTILFGFIWDQMIFFLFLFLFSNKALFFFG